MEVADSSLPQDRLSKARIYAGAGIPEYWIVNLVERQLEVFREPTSVGYARTRILALGDSIAPLACPGTLVSVADLLP